MKVMGFKWKDLYDLENADEFLLKIVDAILCLIEKENEYVADFSSYEGMSVGLPYNIPFVFRK